VFAKNKDLKLLSHDSAEMYFLMALYWS